MRPIFWLPLLFVIIPWLLELATRVKHKEHAPTQTVVVVTGAGKGVGLALTLELASRGVLVVAGVRSERDLQKFPKDSNIHPFLLDVSLQHHRQAVLEEVTSLVQSTGRTFGGIVANAALLFRTPNEYDTDEQEQKVFDVNYFGTVRLIRTFFPLLLAHKSRVVIVGTTGIIMPVPFVSTYLASKSALLTYANSLRAEVEFQGVAVVYVSLGTVKTEMLSEASGGDALNGTAYAPLAQTMEKVFKQVEPLSATTQQVAPEMVDLLFIPYPPCTAYVGLDTKLSVLTGLLPRRVAQILSTTAW